MSADDDAYWERLTRVVTKINNESFQEFEKRMGGIVESKIKELRTELTEQIDLIKNRLAEVERAAESSNGDGRASKRSRSSGPRSASVPLAAEGRAADECRIWINGFPRKLLKEDFDEVANGLLAIHVAEDERNEVKKLTFNLAQNFSFVFPTKHKADAFMDKVYKDAGAWRDERDSQVYKLRARRDMPMAERELRRFMGELWQVVRKHLGTKLDGFVLGSARGSLYAKKGRQLYEFVEIKIDYKADHMAITGKKVDRYTCNMFGITEGAVESWVNELADELGTARL